jgi:PAS domain S-box-containing protein
MGVVSASLLDAAILVLLYGIPLYFLVIRPLSEGCATAGPLPRSAHMMLFLKILSVIFLVEFLMMMFLPEIFPALNGNARNVVDAGLTILLSLPLLWWLLFRSEMRVRIAFLADLLGAPLKLYILLLFLVFLGDLLELLLFPLILDDGNRFTYKIVDSYLISLFAAPFLWLFMVKPLMRSALFEKTRAAALQAQVIDAIMVIDAQGVIESVNPAAERIFGYSASEIAGRRATMLLCDQQQSLDELLLEAPTGANGNAPPVSHEFCGRRRDGSLLTMDVSISRVLQNGRQTFLAIIRDITRRKETEAALRESAVRFRDIFEQTEDAIFFFKPRTCDLIDVNHAAEKLYGYNKEELKETGMEHLSSPENSFRLNRFIRGIRNSEITSLGKIAGLRKDGTEIIVSIRGKMVTLQGVDIVYVTMRDITTRIRLEEEARLIQTKLIEANKMTSLGLMVSGVAHEINNPNNFIMANAQLLSRSWDDALMVLREYHRENGDFLIGGIPFSEMETHSPQLFAGIIDGARRINEIIGNLKSFARQEHTVAKQDVDFNKVVTAAVSILHHELIKYTENFHLDLDEGIPHVKGSGQQLGQVIINLLMNACQSLPHKHCGIWLATGFDAATGQVTTTVRDEGSGMSRDVGNRIMEPFFTTKLDTGGTGLGLSICQSIIKDHNGFLEFKSEPGNGTTFVVKIPEIKAA